jgi:hypothetical protein
MFCTSTVFNATLLSTTGMSVSFTPSNKIRKQQERQCTYNKILRCVCATIVAVEKQWVLHNLSVCVFVALGIQHAMHVHHIGISGLPRSTLFFPHYLTNGTIFEKKLLDTKCVLILSTTIAWNISHSKNKWVRCDKNVYWSSCKVPFILVRF